MKNQQVKIQFLRIHVVEMNSRLILQGSFYKKITGGVMVFIL